MRTVKFKQDFRFNVHGGAGGQTDKKEGEVYSCGDELADRLVNHWQVATYHDMEPAQTKPTQPSQTKPAGPTEHKATHIGGGWYEITAGEEVVDKVRGKDNKNKILKQLNG